MTSTPDIVTGRSRLRFGLGAVVVLVLAGLAIAVLTSVLGSHGATTDVSVGSSPRPITTASVAPTGPANAIYIHVIGAVTHPGLFVLHQGDRAVDAVAAAGGFIATADQTQLNLARVLADGEQIVVPVQGEAPPVSSATGSSSAGGVVNLNTADLTALETLPRVGPAMAQRILDWRKKNGRFSAVEDLMSVTGIGEKTFDGLKELVTV